VITHILILTHPLSIALRAIDLRPLPAYGEAVERPKTDGLGDKITVGTEGIYC